MVSIGPYSQAYDMRQMYDFVDWNSSKNPKVCIPQNSLMGIVNSNSDFSIFSKIIKKACYEGKLSDKQAEFTLFVPSDMYILNKYDRTSLDNIDESLAKKILSFSLMNRIIDKNLFKSSPISTFPTLDRSNSMMIENVNNITILPNNTRVIHWNHKADNGIIHVVDNILIPSDKP